MAGSFTDSALGWALDTANDYASALFKNWLNKKNAKKSYERQIALEQLYYTKWRPMEQWQDYDMAQRYAENSAKWEVTGLKNAGLNPILAASSVGDLGSSYSAPSGGASSAPDIDSADAPRISSILDAMNTVASTESLGEQSQTTKEMRQPLVANAKEDTRIKQSEVHINEETAKKIAAEKELVKANTAKALKETEIVDRPKNWLAEGADWATRRIVDAIRSGFDLHDTYRTFHPVEHQHNAKGSTLQPIEVNSSKSREDAEKQLIRLMEQYNKRIHD